MGWTRPFPRIANGLAVLLASCTSWPTPRPDVDAALRGLRPEQVTAEAPIASELLELADEIAGSPAPKHVVGLLDTGADAFTARLHLIRASRRSLDVQTFNWASDQAGAELVRELVAAARRGDAHGSCDASVAAPTA